MAGATSSSRIVIRVEDGSPSTADCGFVSTIENSLVGLIEQIVEDHHIDVLTGLACRTIVRVPLRASKSSSAVAVPA